MNLNLNAFRSESPLYEAARLYEGVGGERLS